MKDLREQIYFTDNEIRRNKKRIESSTATEKNKELILKFADFCAAAGASKCRISILLWHMELFARYLDKDFDKATRDDMEKAVAKFNQSDYSESTKATVKKNVKQFYRWLYKRDKGDPLPDCVKWIESPDPPTNIKKEDLLTRAEVEKIIYATPHLMYKALISVLYEGAMRPGELLQMRLKDITFNEHYVTLYVRGKMQRKQGDRKIFLVNSYDLLLKWTENHPFKHDKNHPVWIACTHQKYKNEDVYGKVISLAYLAQMVRKCARRADITKRVTPYIFRHSRGTQLYLEMGETLAKKMMGHSPDSDMAKVYCHLNEEDVLQKLKELHGIADIKIEQHNGTCSRCNHPNGFGTSLCAKCGFPLDTKAAMALEAERKAQEEQMRLMKQLLDSLKSNPHIFEMIKNPDHVEKQIDLRAKQLLEKWIAENAHISPEMLLKLHP